MKYQTKILTPVGIFAYPKSYLATLNDIEIAKTDNKGILEISMGKAVNGEIDGELFKSIVTTYVDMNTIPVYGYEEHQIEENEVKTEETTTN